MKNVKCPNKYKVAGKLKACGAPAKVTSAIEGKNGTTTKVKCRTCGASSTITEKPKG